MSNYYEAAKNAGAKGQMDAGQGVIGAAYRYGRSIPALTRPGWTGPPSSFASEAWKAGRDAALAARKKEL